MAEIPFKGRHFQRDMILQSVRWTLAGIEVMAMIKKGQMKTPTGNNQSPAEMFYALAA